MASGQGGETFEEGAGARREAAAAIAQAAASSVAHHASATNTSIDALITAHGLVERQYDAVESSFAAARELKEASAKQHESIKGHLAALDDIEAAISSIEAGAARMDEVTLDLEAALRKR
ncbi:hypothetical protein FNF27_05717 [Cafeteria roenbergensis]|uniref:Uncharacterized protein n=1 Tax=Cafeteria roenbergensis TaxID=33653 RepID=A0A5A8E2Z0_CAFRO|nr:hypothetical protein FNF31_06098 [Cafeteria roenbergensis]KAA0155701.1 hypothetical protein FNF29_01616 [Cafeteria roenbergensis]KAA0171334.1 hypothetical protein FNF28_00825 [Cafeteria roenbergensis]KAA0172856.1 hypothetical protein FNF27_05717 [Cafeteria roenbergensis]|eukprot:KAA0155701.1 hypothetical protein FNF29_01616 [Cafeteria roenbergensis]